LLILLASAVVGVSVLGVMAIKRHARRPREPGRVMIGIGVTGGDLVPIRVLIAIRGVM